MRAPRRVRSGDDGGHQDQGVEVRGPQHGQAASGEEGEDVGDEVEAGRGCDFGVPDVEVAIAVGLGLADVEDFILEDCQ